jgi:hypothetical protein
MNPLRLDNAHYRLAVHPGHGAITSLVDKAGGYDLVAERRLAESFRLLLPLPGLHANYLRGRDQKLTRARRIPDGLELHWAGPLVNDRGRFPLAVTLWIELVGEAVQFRCEVVNRTKHQVAEVWCPILGGLMGLGKGDARRATQVMIPNAYDQIVRDLFREFGAHEALGVSGMEHSWTYPGWMPMPWTSFYNTGVGRGLYFGSHDRVARTRALWLGMEPGMSNARVGGDWPTPAETRGQPTGVSMSWVYLPYTKPGATFRSAPVVLQAHAGSWRRSARIYGDWYRANFPLVDSRTHWLRKETAFLDTMFMLPEDNINVRFADIPRWARTAAKHGLGSVMISGWQIGGHDRGYPQYTPDPQLGTWKELAAGIRACHELGLRVYFFANIMQADVTIPWYRRELHRYAIRENTGNPYYLIGFGMGTLSARRGLTRPTLADLNPAFAQVRELHVRQFRKLAELGADGIHLDKIVPGAMDFNPAAPGGPDRSIYEGIIETVGEIVRVCRAVNPEFCISYEGNFDRLMAFSDVCWWGNTHAAMKEVFPQWTGTMPVNQPYSYNVVNLAVLRARNLLVGPAHYTKDMDDPPMRALNRYIAAVTRIRRELVDVLSLGAVVASSEPPFVENPPPVRLAGAVAKNPDVRWTLFRNEHTGRRALVLANLGRTPVTTTVSVLTARGAVWRLEQPSAKAHSARLPAKLTLPAERVAVLAEP